jgi:hypothetical protein
MANSSTSSGDATTSRSWRRWAAAGVFLVFFAVILWEVINPYRGQRFEKIPHGDHVHFVPKDRNPDVPVSRFPTERPGPDEQITPDGQVVPRSDGPQQ